MTDPIPVPGLHELPFAIALREGPILYGAMETLHLLGVALLVGPVIAFDLRVLGLGRSAPVSALARQLLPIAVTSLVLIIPSGLAMFAAHSDQLLADQSFFTKMMLIMMGGVLAVVFHTGPYRSVSAWNVDDVAPASARVIAAFSILGWICVISLGATLR